MSIVTHCPVADFACRAGPASVITWTISSPLSRDPGQMGGLGFHVFTKLIFVSFKSTSRYHGIESHSGKPAILGSCNQPPWVH